MAKKSEKKGTFVYWSPLKISDFKPDVISSRQVVCDDKQRRTCEKCGHCCVWLYREGKLKRCRRIRFTFEEMGGE